jgi:hypothetical protein
MNFTTHLHLEARLGMSGAIPLPPFIPSWHGQAQCYLNFTELSMLWMKGKVSREVKEVV